MDSAVRTTRPPLGEPCFTYNSSQPQLGPRPSQRQAINQTRIAYQSKLSVIMTDRCNILCAHCLPECDGSKSTALTLPEIQSIIDGALQVPSIDTISFTGGEPFLDMTVLRGGIRYAAERGLQTTVMTNAFWAASEAKAYDVLASLPGLSRLGLSTDRFHQAFIPIDKIINGVRAAHRHRLRCAVRVCHLDSPDEELAEVQAQLAEVSGYYDLEQQPVQPLGRAETDIDYASIFSFRVSAASCRSADLHAVNPDGRLTACCGATGQWPAGHPLDFGNVREEPVSDILGRMNQSHVLHAVRLWGPARLLELAAAEAHRQGATIADPGINNLCEMCRHVCLDPTVSGYLRQAMARPEVQRAVAVARLMDLAEPDLLCADDPDS